MIDNVQHHHQPEFPFHGDLSKSQKQLFQQLVKAHQISLVDPPEDKHGKHNPPSEYHAAIIAAKLVDSAVSDNPQGRRPDKRQLAEEAYQMMLIANKKVPPGLAREVTEAYLLERVQKNNIHDITKFKHLTIEQDGRSINGNELLTQVTQAVKATSRGVV